MSDASRQKLASWLNKNMKITMSDGRVLVGIFMCTDKECNVILASCSEYVKEDSDTEPRTLGLAMIPGQHIRQVCIDRSTFHSREAEL